MLQVAAGDLLLLGVAGQPALAVAQQLLDLVVADPVVLVVVEDRDSTYRCVSRSRERQRRRAASTEKYGLSPHSGNRSSSGCRVGLDP